MRTVLLVALFLFSIAIADEELKIMGPDGELDVSWVNPAGSNIQTLTKDNFDETIKNNEHVMVEFFAPWCPHCQSVAATYEELANAYKEKGSSIVFAKVSGHTDEALVMKYEVDGYPRFKFWRSGVPCTYDGPGSVDAISQFLEKKMQPNSKLLATKEEVDEYLKTEGTTRAVAAVDTKSLKYWRKLSDGDGFDWLSFAHVTDPSLLGLDKAGVKIFPPVGKEVLMFNDIFVYSKIHKFVTEKGYPVLQPLTEDSWHEISAKGTPHVCVFFKEGQENFDMAIDLAKKFQGKAIFTYKVLNDSTTYWAEQWGASGEFYPTAIMISWPQVNEPIFTVYDENNGTFTGESGEQFVSLALEGKYECYRKSDPIPEKNDYPITVIVAKEFEKIVYDESKDVIVDFYSPWCEYSMGLEPTWKLVGEVFEKYPDIIIGSMDLPSNRPPSVIEKNITETPTIWLFPAGKDKMNYVSFPDETERTVVNIVQFIMDHATNRVDIDMSTLPPEPEEPEYIEEEPEEVKFEL